MKYFRILLCVLLLAMGLIGCTGKKVDKISIAEQDMIREKLVVEGLTEEYDLLFLTDTHMVVSSTEDTEQITANGAERGVQFVDDKGVSSALQFPAWMTYTGEQKVDAVLFGGDIIDYPSKGNLEHLQENLNMLSVPYIYTLGNHDWTYPWEYMTQRAEEEYLPLLEPMMQGNTTIQRMDIGELTVVAVDNSSGQVNGEALEAYRQILAEGRPTIVLVHVPFMTQSVLGKAKEVWSSPVVIGAGNYGGIYENEESAAFVQMTTAENSPVVAVLAGHVHFYDKDYIEGEKKVLQLVGDAGFKRKGMMLHISGKEE